MRLVVRRLTEPGWAIVIAIAVLVLIGLASIYVTDTHYTRDHDGPRNAAKQFVRLLISTAVGLVILRIGYQRIARFAYVIFGVVIVLLVPLLLARLLHSSFGGLAAPRNGAYRWLHLPGFLLQPSEFMRVAYVIALAWYLRYRENYRTLGGLLLPLAVSIVPLALILLEPDLGTALLLLPVFFAMLFMAGARRRHLLLVILIGLAGVPIAWGQIKGYQRARVVAVLLQSDGLRRAAIAHPERYELLATKRQAIEWAASSGYQLVHSKNAVGSGGVLGHGWGKGEYVRSGLLPDRHNDFVFAVVAQQWGLVGCLVVLCAYVAIVLSGARIASVTTDPLGRLLAVGIVILLSVQVVINVGMTIGLMPITGMTLPFVSYGGSSLLSNAIGIALLISVSQNRPFLLATRPFEFGREGSERGMLLDHERADAGPGDRLRRPAPPREAEGSSIK